MLKTGCWISLFVLAGPVYSSIPSLKVLIAKSLKNVVVEGMDMQKTIHAPKTHAIGGPKQYPGRKAISFNCDPGKIKTAFAKNPLLVASLSSPTGLISWGKNKYQGELQLLANPNQASCDLVNLIPMEAYISTLLAKEMNGTWPVEALKAQAVAARTYAFDRLKRDSSITLETHEKLYHLESSEKDQVSGTYSDNTATTLKAGRETEGEILIGPSGRVSPAFFHSKCGGKTLRPDQVWGGVEEGYRSVNCPFCQKTGMKDWQQEINSSKVTNMVDQVLRRYYADQIQEGELKLMPDNLENSELRLYAGDRLHIIKKSYLRNLMGREILPSNYFIMSMKNNKVHVKGQGHGHGVGLCQLGALELAKRGYNYRQILSHYFPRHRIKKAY